jgi:cholesterol transport system auxiliary component
MMRLSRSVLLVATLALGACSAITGKSSTFTVYAPQLAKPSAQTAVSKADWQLQIELPQSSAALDSARIAVMPRPGVLEVYPGARWRDPAPALLRSLMVQAFDDSARVAGVSAADSGLSADYSLAIELRDFQLEVQGAEAAAALRYTAKLFHRASNRIVATRQFDDRQASTSTDIQQAMPAFEGVLNQSLLALVDWTVNEANQHRAARQ